MTMPKITITKQGGNLGRLAANEDGVSALILTGIAVAGQFDLGDIVGPLYQIEDAEALGIDAAYDTTNKVLAHKHISDFFEHAGAGKELYVMVLDEDITMEDMADKTKAYAKHLLSTLQGKVRLLGITRVPPSAYAPTHTGQFDPDVWAAITAAQELVDEEFTAHRPVSVIIEGRDFQGTPGSATDLRTLDAPDCSVMIGADPDISAVDAKYGGYAAVGIALGRLAAIAVQRNIGRVKDGALTIDQISLSDADELYLPASAHNDTDLDAMDTKGYIFFRRHVGKAGYYFNNDHTCVALTSDFAYIHLNRPIDKVCRLAREIFTEELLEDVEVSADGKLSPSVIKELQGNIDNAVVREMIANGELSDFYSYIDPDQDVLSSDEIEVQLNPTPKGMVNEVSVTVAYAAE